MPRGIQYSITVKGTIGMVWGLTSLKHSGNKVLGQYGVNFNVCIIN